MYNPEWKMKFISEFTRDVDLAKMAHYTFEATEPFEIKFKKDVCTFSVEEMQEAADAVLPVRSKSKGTRKNILREYARWALCYGVRGAKVTIDKVGVLGLEKMREQTFSSPRSFAKYLDAIFRPVEERTKDDILRGFLWMIYMGIEREDCGKIDRGDVSFYDMAISFGGIKYEIYREASPVFHNLVNLKSFSFDHGNYTAERERVPGTQLLRGIRTEFSLKSYSVEISGKVSKAINAGLVKEPLNTRRFAMCGKFYRVLEMELDGIPPNFSDVAAREYTNRRHPGKSEEQLRALQISAVNGYLDDYHRWKVAHGI